ncbi:hypothetical protein ACI3ET_01150 [Ornithinimicrobium sp. LYQ121]|uniref:hypothetical protein n=1 Tax=Ornithinimicrobium sp. LYQ121 TaxID=3378801 RepID=UPI003853CDE6
MTGGVHVAAAAVPGPLPHLRDPRAAQLLVLALVAGELQVPLRRVVPMVLLGRTLRLVLLLGLGDYAHARL